MRKIKTVLAILIIISLATAFTGCVEDEEDEQQEDEIFSIEARVSPIGRDAYQTFKARGLQHSEFDFVIEKELEDGYWDKTIYNRVQEKLYQSEPGTDEIWKSYEGVPALRGANQYWNNIEMIVEEIMDRGMDTDDFTFTEIDDDGVTIRFSVTSIRINHNIPDSFFHPPSNAEVIPADPGDTPT